MAAGGDRRPWGSGRHAATMRMVGSSIPCGRETRDRDALPRSRAVTMRVREPWRALSSRCGGTVMASVEFDSKTENDVPAEVERRPRIAWDSSLGATPLGHGWDAEPLVLDWYGQGEQN